MVEKRVDEVASVEEGADDERCLQVVVHGVVATLAQLAHELMCVGL